MQRLEELVNVLRAFNAEREWEQFHDPKNLSMAVASEAGELLAEYRWVANDQADAYSKDVEARARVADEIADVGIALVLLCDRIQLDLVSAMAAKVEANRQRYPADEVRGSWTRPGSTSG